MWLGEGHNSRYTGPDLWQSQWVAMARLSVRQFPVSSETYRWRGRFQERSPRGPVLGRSHSIYNGRSAFLTALQLPEHAGLISAKSQTVSCRAMHPFITRRTCFSHCCRIQPTCLEQAAVRASINCVHWLLQETSKILLICSNVAFWSSFFCLLNVLFAL